MRRQGSLGRKKGTRLLPVGTVVQFACGHTHTMQRPVHPRRVLAWEQGACIDCRAAQLEAEGKLTPKDSVKLHNLRQMKRHWAEALRPSGDEDD